METTHRIIVQNSNKLIEVPDRSIALVVTSPPYPMIEMWDECFAEQNNQVKNALDEADFSVAFHKMHEVLERTWEEVDRVLIENGFVCINIGDATRNCNGVFKLFPNHVKVVSFFEQLGYSILPDIHWRKQTNAPNKFLGSGMYPAGAYVTYEHEYILIFRKGGKRVFTSENEKATRRESAYFWEERNVWFSDLWDLKGTSQNLNGVNGRKRSAAYPFELAYRLINMYSVKGDTVLDPFNGLGTSSLAALASERNSIGFEIDKSVCDYAVERLKNSRESLNQYIQNRLVQHMNHIENNFKQGKRNHYKNHHHGFDVNTRQERDLIIRMVKELILENDLFRCKYKDAFLSHQQELF